MNEKEKIKELRDKSKIASEINTIIVAVSVSKTMFQFLTDLDIDSVQDFYNGNIAKFSFTELKRIKECLVL